MTHARSRIIALTLSITGMALLIVSAADYLLGWDRVSSAISALGLTLVVIGSRYAARARVGR